MNIWYILLGDFMELYYKNETLFVDINSSLDEENLHVLKRRIFRIVDDYEIDHIVFNILQDKRKNMRLLQGIQREYHSLYQGDLLIK